MKKAIKAVTKIAKGSSRKLIYIDLMISGVVRFSAESDGGEKIMADITCESARQQKGYWTTAKAVDTYLKIAKEPKIEMNGRGVLVNGHELPMINEDEGPMINADGEIVSVFAGEEKRIEKAAAFCGSGVDRPQLEYVMIAEDYICATNTHYAYIAERDAKNCGKTLIPAILAEYMGDGIGAINRKEEGKISTCAALFTYDGVLMRAGWAYFGLTFPNIKAVIPKAFSNYQEFEIKKFSEEVKELALEETATETICVRVIPGLDNHYNVKYLQTIIKKMLTDKNGKVSVREVGLNKASIFQQVGDDDFVILTPIRVSK